MHKYKRIDHLVNALNKFILLQAISRLLFFFLCIIIFSSSAFFYQKFAFDHIKVYATDERAVFDLKVSSEFENFSAMNLSTPFSIKVPKGDKIEVEITNNSERICGILKSGYSSLQISHSQHELKLTREKNYLKGGKL